MKTTGEKIKEYRKICGFTQKEFANILGVATGTIQQYELNKRQPRLEDLDRIAEILHVNTWDLYDGYELNTEPFKSLNDLLPDGYHIMYDTDNDDEAHYVYPDSKSIPVSPENVSELYELVGDVLRSKLDAYRREYEK